MRTTTKVVSEITVSCLEVGDKIRMPSPIGSVSYIIQKMNGNEIEAVSELTSTVHKFAMRGAAILDRVE